MNFNNTNQIICIGHRGAKGHEPENTLLSIQKAIDLGVNWIEVDVYAIDNELVVIHDRRLERTTDGTGYTQEQSFSYLRSLDAGKGEQIPTLREVFDLVDRKVGINVELKGENTAEPVAQVIQEYISQGWTYNNILVSSFNHQELKQVKNICPDINVGALIVGIPLGYAEFAEDIKASVVINHLDFLHREFVEDAHQRGLKVFVFTVNDPEDISRMINLKVDGIFTDYPERVLNK